VALGCREIGCSNERLFWNNPGAHTSAKRDLFGKEVDAQQQAGFAGCSALGQVKLFQQHPLTGLPGTALRSTPHGLSSQLIFMLPLYIYQGRFAGVVCVKKV